MQFDFQSVINALNQNMPFGDNFAFKIARTSVVPSDYLFNSILPQEDKVSYHVDGGSMRIFPTMAQLMPMDTPPPPIGAMTSSFFNENTSKFGGSMHFPEAHMRAIQEWAQYAVSQALNDGLPTGDIAAKKATEAVFGLSDLLLKSQWDNLESLRSEVLTTGALSRSNGSLNLTADYDVPTANKITRTGAGDSYYGTTSKFWTDIRTVLTKLNNVRFITNSNTYYSIIDNSVNSVNVANSFGNVRELQKVIGTTERLSPDARDRMSFVLYDKSGSGITPKGVLQAKPFLPDGKIIVLGEQQPDGFELTQGSTPDPDNLWRLGYTHIAPSTEGGRPGIFQRIFTPEAKPMQLLGETYLNALPVITNPNKLMILTTDLP